MASSFVSQIPSIIYLIQQLNPITVLDIGKGFGKYGFLIHEYLGIDNKNHIDPSKSMVEQSRIKIDAIEADKDLLLPHLSHLYNNVFFGDVFDTYKATANYDLILMIDVIEHLDKEKAIQLIRHYLAKGSAMIIATPINFFKQELYESEYEHHISHWTLKDFDKVCYLDHQYLDGGAIYLLSNTKRSIRGFGNSYIKKLRRFARAIKNEF